MTAIDPELCKRLAAECREDDQLMEDGTYFSRTQGLRCMRLQDPAMNKTRYKSLDTMACDPRIIEIWDEGADGIWAQLAPGYNFDGSSCLHEWTVRALIKAWRTQISVGPIDPPVRAVQNPKVT